MRYLVTGSSGFIGSHLVEALQKEGHEVKGIDIKSPVFHDAPTELVDIADSKKVMDTITDVDFVFHLAGLLGTHELVNNSYQATVLNIGGTVNVLEACKKIGAKMILASKPNCWLNTYTITKVAAENFVKMYRREYGVKAAILKWFNVYGPRQPLMEEIGYKKFIPHAIVDSLNGRPIEIYGNGGQTIDLIHTDDTVTALLAIANNWDECEGRTFEAGCNKISVNDVAEMLLGFTGSSAGVKRFPMRRGETEDTKIASDITALKKFTGWAPKITLEDGLKDTINWYKNNKI